MSNGDTAADVVTAGDRAVTQPADSALGYGEKAVGQGKAAAKPPAKKAKSTYLDLANQARDMLAKSFPELEKVVIHEWAKVPNQYVRKNRPKWYAWTNSATDVYVTAKIANPADAESIIYHELLHVQDFIKGGGVPSSYVDMVGFEIRAYGETARYLDAKIATKPPPPNVNTYRKWSKASTDTAKYLVKLTERHKTLSGDMLDFAYADDLVADSNLPREVMDKKMEDIAIPAPKLYVP